MMQLESGFNFILTGSPSYTLFYTLPHFGKFSFWSDRFSISWLFSRIAFSVRISASSQSVTSLFNIMSQIVTKYFHVKFLYSSDNNFQIIYQFLKTSSSKCLLNNKIPHRPWWPSGIRHRYSKFK